MTARFSADVFEQPASAQILGASAAAEPGLGLQPSPECNVLTVRSLDMAPPAGGLGYDDEEVFIPAGYEKNYAYPLLAWLFQSGSPKGNLGSLMRLVSERNCIGVAIPVVETSQIEDQLVQAFARLRRRFHVHTERVHLLGIGNAGSQALEVGLRHPGFFAGIAAFSARWCESPRPLAQFADLRGKRVLLGVRSSDSAQIVSDALYAQRLLWSCGVDVTALASSDSGEPPANLLREVDRWVLRGIE